MAIKHGLYGHILYTKWIRNNQKCINKKNKDYKYYGSRGITVCDEWRYDFEAFYNWSIKNGWEETLELDRIDNDGNYEPNNCRFVTHQENCCNKRLIQKNNTSGYRGVMCDKKYNKYNIQVRYKNKTVLTKYGFKNSESAAIARDTYIIKHNLPHKLNFMYLKPNINLENGWMNTGGYYDTY